MKEKVSKLTFITPPNYLKMVQIMNSKVFDQGHNCKKKKNPADFDQQNVKISLTSIYYPRQKYIRGNDDIECNVRTKKPVVFIRR